MALTDIKIENIQGYAGAGLGLKGLANIQIISNKEDIEDTEDYEEKQKAFLELNNNILNNYEQLNKLQEELTKTQLKMQQASEILKPSYMAKYQSLLKQYNDLSNQMNNAITERDKIIQNQQLKNLQMSQPQPITQKQEEGMKQLDLQGLQGKQTQQPLPITKQQIIPETPIKETSPPKESKWKDVLDVVKLTSTNMWHNSKQYFTTLLPKILYPHLTEEDARAIENKYDLPTGAIKEENLNKVNDIYDRRREELEQAGQKAEQEFMQYLKEHPELQPREEWSEGVIETVKKNPKILLDPTYWAYVAAQSAIYSLAITGTTLGTAALTGNPVAGMMAGVAVATPMQSQELYNELIENGASEKDAARLAMMIGPVIAGVEVLGDLPFLASLSQPFKKMLYKNITSAVVNNLAAKGLIKAGQIYGSELGEELIQEGIIKGTVKTFNENIDIVKDMPEIAAQTLIAVTPMAILGGGLEVRQNIQLNKKLQQIKEHNIFESMKKTEEMEAEEIKTEKKPEVTKPTIPVEKPAEELVTEKPKAKIKKPEIILPKEEKKTSEVTPEVKLEEKPKAEIKKPEITLPEEEKITPKGKVAEESITKKPKAGIKKPEITLETKPEKIPEVKPEIKLEKKPKAGIKKPEITLPKIPEEKVSEKPVETASMITPKIELPINITQDIEQKAKSLSKEQFAKYWNGFMQQQLNNNSQLYQNIKRWAEDTVGEEEILSSDNLYDALTGKKKTIYSTDNIRVRVINSELLKDIGTEEQSIIKDLVNFIQKKYPNKKLTISIGKQAISNAGENAFRIGIPKDYPVEDMLVYDESIIPILQQLKQQGVPNKQLWAASDMFHELAHTLGIKDEIKADKLAIQLIQEWTQTTPTITPVEGEKTSPSKKVETKGIPTKVEEITKKPIAETQRTWVKEVETKVAKSPDPITKIEDMLKPIQEELDEMIDSHTQFLIETSGKGVDTGLIPTEEGGYTRYAVSQNPPWYQRLYKQLGKTPTKKQIREEAISQLEEGIPEEGIPPDTYYLQLKAQADALTMVKEELENIIDLAEPKVIEKVIERVVEVEVPRKPVSIKNLTPEEIEKGNKLIGQIHQIAKEKGLTKKEFENIKRTYGGSPHLSTETKRMPISELEEVLKAIKRIRPKRIGYKQVITPKTERKIQSLKDNLIDRLQMTEKDFDKVLKMVGVYKEPKYIDAKHFITEQKGKEIIKALLNEAEIRKITLPYEKAIAQNPEIKQAVDKIDDRIARKSIKMKDPSDLSSMRYYVQNLERITKAPFYAVYQALIDANLENRHKMEAFIEEFEPYKKIIADEEAIKRVEDYIVSKSNLKNKPTTPEDITPKEIELANKIQKILKDYEVIARTEKFLDNIDNLENMPQYERYKKEMNKAKDIYESQGYEPLVEYMKTQEWGIIKNGYAPIQVMKPTVRLYLPGPMTFSKSHIQVRTDIEFKPQDENIVQRLFTYKKRMDNLSNLRPKMKAFVALTIQNLNKFQNPQKVENNIEIFLREIRGYSGPTGWFDEALTRMYAQAATTVIMINPALAIRNLGQNIAFGFDKEILIDPRNKALNDGDMNYFHTYVTEYSAIQADWLMVEEKPLIFPRLTKIAQKIKFFPYTDFVNRLWCYWGKVNQTRRAFTGNKTLEESMKEAHFDDLTLIEQKTALGILAKDGKEAMIRYVARVYTDKIHFLYDRSQRSPAEMGRTGKYFGNLMLFPRAYAELLYQESEKMVGKDYTLKERMRAFKVIASIIIGGMLVGAAYSKVTGRKESSYDFFNIITYQPGGLQLGALENASKVFNDMVLALRGDKKALYNLTSEIPAAADMFIPFYNYFIRGIEASQGAKNIDKYALRMIISLIDKEYEVRGGAYKLERNALQKWQYILSGSAVDIAIAEELAKQKKKEQPAPEVEDILKSYKTKFPALTAPATVSPETENILKKYKW